MSYEIRGPIERVKPSPRKLSKVLPGLFAGEVGAVVIVPQKDSEINSLITHHLALVRYVVTRCGYVIDAPETSYESRGLNVDMSVARKPAVNSGDIILSAATIISNEAIIRVVDSNEQFSPHETIITQVSLSDPGYDPEQQGQAVTGLAIYDFVLRGSGLYEPAGTAATI